MPSRRTRVPVERIKSSSLASNGLAWATSSATSTPVKKATLASAGKRGRTEAPSSKASGVSLASVTVALENEWQRSPEAGRSNSTPRSKASAATSRPTKQQKIDQKVKEYASPSVKEELVENEGAEPADDLSAYEKMRKANMDRNRQILDALALPSMPAANSMVAVKARGLKGISRVKEELLPTRERSLRVQGKAPDGKQLELPADWREPIRFNPSARKESGGKCSSSMGGGEEEVVERRIGDLNALDCVPKDHWAEDPEALFAEDSKRAGTFLSRMHQSDMECKGSACSGVDVIVDELKELAVSESDVAKVCTDRIVSVGFHPMEQHVVVAAGDKRGNIGFFTPDWASDDSCVTLLRVHRQSTTWLQFDALRPHSLYSSSYENIVRRLDVERQVFCEVHRLEEDEYKFLATCHVDSTASLLRCGFGSGHLQSLDVRGGRPTTLELHDKTIRSIDVSPVNNFLLLTASIDSYARVWDVRKLRRGGWLGEVSHGQGVTQARFSQGCASMAITTSYDDTCKVVDVPSCNVRHTVKHNNCTGRWLTAFQAVFVPRSDALCVIGSMEALRGVDVIDVQKGKRVCRLTSEAYASITSVNVWHPNRKLLAGGNSSGKLYLWR